MPKKKANKKSKPVATVTVVTKAPKQPRSRRGPVQSTGARVGAHVGDFLQKGALGLFKRITGLGDYKVSRNSLMSGADPPIMRNGIRSNLIRHREYVGDITGSASFAITGYPINPGNNTLFPWLAPIAAQYEQYTLHGMVVEFKSTSADSLNSTNTALGTVILSTEYNVLSPAFTNKIAMENHEFSTSSRPSTSMLHPIECDPKEMPSSVMFNRPLATTTNNDLRFVDWGNLYVATVGMQAASVIGELWVTYEVEFHKPFVNPSSYSLTGASAMWHFTGASVGNYFGTTGVPISMSGSASAWMSNVTLTPTSITFSSTTILPIGSAWGVVYSMNGGACPTPVGPTFAISGATVTSVWDNGAGAASTKTNVTAGGSDTFACALTTFTVTSAIVAITLTGGTLPATASSTLALMRLT